MENSIMRKTLLFLILFLAIGFQITASPVYKTFSVNGETFSRWVVERSVIEYDSSGKEIYSKSLSGNEWRNEYDSDGNLIKKWSDDSIFLYEYDADGNLIHEKRSFGKSFFDEHWYEYDVNGNQIYSKNSYDNELWDECWYEYDAYGN